MIVVSSAGLTGQQAFTLLTTAAGSRPGLTQLTSSSSPITITMPAGRGRGAAAGGGQIVALPAQGLLPSGGAITIQTKPGVSPAQKVLTIVTTTNSTTTSRPHTVVTQVGLSSPPPSPPLGGAGVERLHCSVCLGCPCSVNTNKKVQCGCSTGLLLVFMRARCKR